MIFRVGDVVIFSVADSPGMAHLLDKTGVVKVIGQIRLVGVEFDEAVPGGHNLGGYGRLGHGWYVAPASLTKMHPIREVLQKVMAIEELPKPTSLKHPNDFFTSPEKSTMLEEIEYWAMYE